MKTIIGLLEAGEPLIRQADEALRAYHEARDCGRSNDEVELLQIRAESLYQAVTDYQLRSLATESSTLQ